MLVQCYIQTNTISSLQLFGKQELFGTIVMSVPCHVHIKPQGHCSNERDGHNLTYNVYMAYLIQSAHRMNFKFLQRQTLKYNTESAQNVQQCSRIYPNSNVRIHCQVHKISEMLVTPIY